MIYKIIMPKLGETMEEGILNKWLKKEGDKVKKGEPLFEVTTDKATFEQEALADGYLRKIIAKEGENVLVTKIIGYIADSMEEEVPEEEIKEKQVPDTKLEQPEVKINLPLSTKERINISPVAKTIAQENNIDITKIKGSGPAGRITKEDVLAVIKSLGNLEKSRKIKLTPIQKITGDRLTKSKREIPHYYLEIEVNMDKIVELREKLLPQLEKEIGVRLTYNDLIVKFVGKALKEYPFLNATFDGEEINTFDEVNLGIAVAIEQGLIVPVIKDINKKDIKQIVQERNVLLKKAQENKLTLGEISDGTFTVTNLGMYEIDNFMGIINPPQVGLLAIGVIKEKPVVIEHKINSCYMMKMTLSCDHRVVNGAYSAKFLQRLKQILETPDL